MANHVIIAAAGKSTRIGKGINKTFLPLLGKPMLYYTIKAFENCSAIDSITIATKKEDIEKINNIKNNNNFKKIKDIVEGGIERQDSVYNGLMAIRNSDNNVDDNDIVIVHNGSNPLVKGNEIIECITAAKEHGAAVVGFPVKDTLKEAKDNEITKTIDRANLWQMQTPQAIKYGLSLKAFENARNKNLKFTDDVSLIEAIGHKVKVVKCSNENIKITTPEDLAIAEGIIRMRSNAFNDFRVGLGMDSHAFSENRQKPLVLGGFIVPDELGLEADSDGDVILHALFNAISQAIGDMSLGHYATPLFKEKGVTDSREYIGVIMGKLGSFGYIINNVGITIEAKKPRLEQYSDKIRESLSAILNLDKGRIGLNFTSGDGLTAFGQGKGIQCFAVAAVAKQGNSSDTITQRI